MKSRSFVLAVLAALAFSSAYATQPGNNGNGNGGCGAGQTTNGCGSSTGGAGGAGGIGIAGAASSSTALAAQAQGQSQFQNAHSTSGGNMITTTTTVEAQERNPVSSAYAPGLAAANGTCLGSASGGIQGTAVGFAFGTTRVDAGCDVRYDSAALRAAGHVKAADARLCQKPEIAEAFAAAGTPCTDARKAKTAEATPVTPSVYARR